MAWNRGAIVMATKPTSFDIAQLAGVSQPTVSRALRGSPSVSEQTRKRIEAIAQQLNYKVDKSASSLRRRETNTLALLFFEDPTPDGTLINPFFLSMVGSITRTCAQHGYDLLISFQQLSSNWHVDFEESHKADGIILLGYGDFEQHRSRLEQLAEQHTRFVRWGYAQDNRLGATLGCDNFQGGAAAATHLLDHGRRRIAFLGDISSHCPELHDRYRGACAAMEKAGVQPDPLLQVDAITIEQSGYDAARTLLQRGVPFDAIFAASDLIAIGAIRALEEQGLRVPNDVALVGFDDIPAANLTHPPLTTIQQDYISAGRVLVETLLRLIQTGQAENMVLPARLVVRKSCGASR